MKRSLTVACAVIVLTVAYLEPLYADQCNSYVFYYHTIVHGIPKGANNVNIWIPYPAERSYQNIEVLDMDKQDHELAEDRLGNKALFYNIRDFKGGVVSLGQAYKITRCEESSETGGVEEFCDSRSVSPKLKKLAAEITKGKSGDMEAAHALYNHVQNNLTPGGNLTDPNSLFVSLARAAGIPAKVVMGMSIPEGERGGISSYHSWAKFFAKGIGWVPVDLPMLSFGRLGAGRVEFTQGRDIELNPRQAGGPLNYFIYPYVEVDGEYHDTVDSAFGFERERHNYAVNDDMNPSR